MIAIQAENYPQFVKIQSPEQCCGSGSDHFLISDLVPDPNIFSSRILHEKWNANLLFSCFLCVQEQSLSDSHSVKYPRSGIRKKFIPDPDPGGKKATDPGSGSATLPQRQILVWFYTHWKVVSILGNIVYHSAATLHAMANPLMAFLAMFLPCKGHRTIWTLALLGQYLTKKFLCEMIQVKRGPRDFRPSFFFVNRLPLGPLKYFRFLFKLFVIVNV
jgi:hypothetical protein